LWLIFWLSWLSWGFLNHGLFIDWRFLRNLIRSKSLLGSLGSSWNLGRLVIAEGVHSPRIVVLAEALECAESTLRFALCNLMAQLWKLTESVNLCLRGLLGSWVMTAEALGESAEASVLAKSFEAVILETVVVEAVVVESVVLEASEGSLEQRLGRSSVGRGLGFLCWLLSRLSSMLLSMRV